MQQKKQINIEIGCRVQEVREQRGLTQEKFAELLDVGVQHVSKIERGVAGTSLVTLKKICQILDVSADYLLLGIGSMQDSDRISKQLHNLPSNQADLVENGIAQILEALELANGKDQ